MDLQKMFNAHVKMMRDSELKYSHQLTVEKLIKKLKTVSQDKKILIAD
jgi:hypothetical protein